MRYMVYLYTYVHPVLQKPSFLGGRFEAVSLFSLRLTTKLWSSHAVAGGAAGAQGARQGRSARRRAEVRGHVRRDKPFVTPGYMRD